MSNAIQKEVDAQDTTAPLPLAGFTSAGLPHPVAATEVGVTATAGTVGNASAATKNAVDVATRTRDPMALTLLFMSECRNVGMSELYLSGRSRSSRCSR